MNPLYLGNTFPTFRDQFGLLVFEDNGTAIPSSGTAHQASQTHIPKVLNPQQRCYENLKPCSIKVFNIRICMFYLWCMTLLLSICLALQTIISLGLPFSMILNTDV